MRERKRRVLGTTTQEIIQQQRAILCGTPFGRQFGGGLFEFWLRESELKQLAVRSGIGQAEISKIERSRKSPTLDTYPRLVMALDLDDDILATSRAPAAAARLPTAAAAMPGWISVRAVETLAFRRES